MFCQRQRQHSVIVLTSSARRSRPWLYSSQTRCRRKMSGLTCSREPSSRHSEGHQSALGPLEGNGGDPGPEAELEGSSIACTQPVSTRRRNWDTRGTWETEMRNQVWGEMWRRNKMRCAENKKKSILLPLVVVRPGLGPCLRWASAEWSSDLWRKHSYPGTHTQINICVQ